MHFQQAVYGSFPFWERGYGLLARSPGCRGAWLSEFQAACRNLGEPPPGIPPARAWFARRRGDGGWMVVGIHPQGDDDHGRPGALAFHGLFVDWTTYARAGANPFPLAALTRGDWTTADRDRELPTGEFQAQGVFQRLFRRSRPALDDPRVDAIARALAGKRPVVVHAGRPIDDLAQAVWRALSWRARLRLSLATWAFDNASRFDLVALPKLKGASFDPGALIVEWDQGIAPPSRTTRG